MDKKTRRFETAACRGAAENARIAEQVIAALTATGRPSLRGLEVAASERMVVLRGRVTSYYLKQLAQAAALAFPAVGRLLNEVEVVA